MSNIRKYKLIAGVNVDLDSGEVIKGYYLEKAIYDGGSSSSFFIPGSIDNAVAHIRKTHGIIDKARLEKLSKFLDEAVKMDDEETSKEETEEDTEEDKE